MDKRVSKEIVCASVIEVIAVVTETDGDQEVELWRKDGGVFINRFPLSFFKDAFKDNARVTGE